MLKAEAIQAMKDGKKVAHRHFDEFEWMTIEHGRVVFEDGCECTLEQLFQYRQSADWLCDYFIVVEEAANAEAEAENN